MSEPTPPECCEDGLPEPAPLNNEQIARIGKALGHPARIRILSNFTECRPLIVQQIVEECNLAQSTISEHLRILREAELLFATEDGPRVWYCMRRSVLRSYAAAVQHLAADLQPATGPAGG
jgi:ArsR family transcriptional regulator